LNLKENMESFLRIKKYYKEKKSKTLFEKFFEKFEGIWDFSLDRIKAAIKDLNLDKIYQEKLTILVLGSNGKGSTSYLLKSIILKTNPNLKVGLFTSPHIFSFKERFLINFNFFKTDILDKSFLKLLTFIKKYKLTYFESSFLLALELFKNTDICIFEAGLGGRLDATNALNHNIYILTTISKEHTSILGNSLEKIAFEKLSAVRKNSTLILGEKNFYKLARKFTENIKVYGKDFFIQKNENMFFDKEKNITFKLNLSKNTFHNYKALSLALKAFFEIFNNTNLKSLSITSLDYPLFRTQKLYVNNKFFLFDVAHNEESLKRLFSVLKDEYKKYKGKYKFNFFFTFMKDKNISFLKKFFNYFENSNFYFVSIPHDRALNFKNFLRDFSGLDTKKIYKDFYVFKNTFSVLKNIYPNKVLNFIKEDTFNVFFGSFYLYNYLNLNSFFLDALNS